MRRVSLMLLVVLFQTGCAGFAISAGDSSGFDLAAGSHLMLNSELEIPAHTATAYIQGGRLMAPANVDHYHPHCKFRVRAVQPAPQRIRPDDFVVTRVVRDVFYGVDAGRIQLAGLRLANGNGGFHTYLTELYLHSSAQPQVEKLTCQHLEDPAALPRHVTIEEIRRTLGDLFTLSSTPG